MVHWENDTLAPLKKYHPNILQNMDFNDIQFLFLEEQKRFFLQGISAIF